MVHLKFFIGIILAILQVTILKAWGPLEFIEFKDWAGSISRNSEKIEDGSLPQFVMLDMTNSYPCFSKKECISRLTSDHKIAINDHFFIGGDSRIYIGHGWDLKGPVQICDDNKPILSISFIGNFKFDMIPAIQLQAAQKLLRYGVKAEELSPNYELFGNWQLTDIPISVWGSNAEVIKQLSHWTENVSNCSASFVDDDDTKTEND